MHVLYRSCVCSVCHCLSHSITVPQTIIITASLEIAGNTFSGAVPSELGKLTSLLVIDAEENAFTGTIPTELGMLSHLSVFNFHRNGKMSGTLPGDLCAVSHNLASGDDCSCCS